MSDQSESDGTRGEASRATGSSRSRLVGTWLPAMLASVVVAGVALGGVEIGRSGSPSHGGQRAVLASARSRAVAPNGTITVTGSGTVQGTPNTVSFQIGVHTVEPTAPAALSANDAQVASLEATLMKHGVLKKDMQTSGLNISENMYKNVLTGFSVDDDLNVSMTGIANAGNAIQAAADAVGNGIQLYGVSFSISNQSRLLATARSRAVQNARTEAAQVAAGANATLGGIVRVTDQENTNPGVFQGGGYFNAGMAMASVPLQAGRQPVSVQVTVVYALRG
ncbi:MAG: SIMPL domain-containing protein [Acidimicrobiales bacterium]